MNKLLCIVGTTGTGKTAKAIELSKEQPSIIISADSRQVYRGMDIVTGKDHPTNVPIYGIDIVNPDKPCSVAVWHENVIPHIKSAWEDDILPIVVGGTGLYIKALTEGIATMEVPINQELRDQLTSLSIAELQNQLKLINQFKFESMNNSDQYNSRRLVRAVEIERYNSSKQNTKQRQNIIINSEIIGLSPPASDLYGQIIKQRVLSRIRLGAVEETKLLLTKYDQNLPSMTAIGYSSIIKYIKGEIAQSQMIENWVSGELSYAKRQMTWFRKQQVIWYDVDTARE